MLDKKVISALVNAIKNKGERIENTIDNEQFVKYAFNEISVISLIQNGNEIFYGITFILFGNEVMISADLELISYDEELDDGLIIEDENFLALVNQYLILRVKSINEFKY